jgi:hypothetical protein
MTIDNLYSVLDPALLPGVQDHLAATFGRKVMAAAPEIADFIAGEAGRITQTREKQLHSQAARALNQNRQHLARLVSREFAERFDAKLNPVPARLLPTTRLSLDSLSLVQDEQMEEDLAVSHCGNRLKEQCEYELFALTRRIGILTGRERVNDEDNPIFPRVFARSLMQALGATDSNLQVKIILFKAYGPMLLDIVPDTLASANGWLSERGIDIDVDERYGRPVLRADRPGRADASQAAGDIVGALHRLLDSAEPKETPVDLPNIVSASSVALESGTSSRSRRDLRETLQHVGRKDTPPARMLHAARRALQDNLPADEAMVADVVTVMFDRLFADARVPAVLRETVARLQMPFLHLALRDRTLFSNAAHPARKLIDVLAEFGMTLGLKEADTGTLDSIARIVEDVVRKHASDSAAFKVAYHRMDDLFYHHEESALQEDQTICELQEAEALEAAQSAANDAINERLQGMSMPLAVAAFVQITWRDVLVHDYLRSGANGPDFGLGIATLDELLKSIQPVTTIEAQTSLARSLPSLVDLLKDGMTLADVNPMLADEFLIELEKMHQCALYGKQPAPESMLRVDAPAPLRRAAKPLSPSARLAELGLACGSWLEMRAGVTHERWRLCWTTSFKGMCVLKHYETQRTRICSVSELRDQVLSGLAVAVKDIGLAAAIISDAFRIVARKVRREDQDHDSPPSRSYEESSSEMVAVRV